MIIQTVRFQSELPEAEAMRVADERAPGYRAVPGLVQKYYVKLDGPSRWCGVLIWESREALAAFQQTELAKTIPTAYGVVGAPDVELLEVFEVLRREQG